MGGLGLNQKCTLDFPGGPMVKTPLHFPALPLQGMWLPFPDRGTKIPYATQWDRQQQQQKSQTKHNHNKNSNKTRPKNAHHPATTSLPAWRRKWQSTPVLLPGESHGRRSLVGYSPWGRKESDTTERLHSLTHSLSAVSYFRLGTVSCSSLCALVSSTQPGT